MSKLLYRTIAGERPQGKPNVYFSCHPDDFDRYFEEYATRILKIQDCAIWYESEPEADYDKDDLELNLSQMQMIVMPVTTKLLTAPCRAIEVELLLAKEKHIPVLPLMMEQGLDDVFARHFGNLQYLDPNDQDETRIGFDGRLTTYIRSVLVSDELAEKVRAAFDAYIFLSYRKKDRRKAQELMRLIHRSPLCRDIAIWYDEFLTPGEDFNQAIGKMLQKSDLFALVVTPNLVNEVNYVMTTEYPAAMEQEKPVLPVEMEETDREELEKHYEALPPCVPGEESEAFRVALLEKIRAMAVEANDTDPGHNFLIGLAYLDGIDVEVDAERALELITSSAEAGVPEAMEQLVTMYETGKGVTRDYYEGVRWRERHVAHLRKAYEAEPTGYRAARLISSLWNLGVAQYALRKLEAAETAYSEMCDLTEQYAQFGENRYRRYMSVSYTRLGDIARAKGDLTGAQALYEKYLAIAKELIEETGTVESRRNLSISYEKLGDTARAKGDLAGAQAFYEKSLAIREELVEETGTIESRRDQSFSYGKLGKIAEVQGNLTGAQAFYEKSLAIREELVEETGTIESRGDLCVSYDRLGDTARAQGDLSRAQAFYERLLTITAELSKITGSIESRADLSASYEKLGDTVRAQGDLSRAQACYEKSLVIRKKLSEETGTIKSRRDLSICYEKLGDTAIAKGDLSGAKALYEKSIAITEELAEKTGTTESRRDLYVGYNKLGDTAGAKGDLAGAQAFYEKSLAIAEELVEETGTRQAYTDLASLLFIVGAFYYNKKISKNKAKIFFERIVEIGKKSSDSHLIEIGKKAKCILDNYF